MENPKAKNVERQDMLYLHTENQKTYLLYKKHGNGLVRKEYQPRGNQLIYPSKWGRKKAGEHFLKYMIEDEEKLLQETKERLKLLYNLKEEVKTWE